MFLTESALSAKIKEVLAGRDVACAVAFWGRGSASLLTSATGQRPRVLCNVTLGGTNLDALSDLRTKLDENLRHYENLHSKVYLSDRGLVVGSANASNNGVGLADGQSAGLVEAGSFYEHGTKAWQEAASWFETIFSSAPVVDDAAIATARRTWVPPRRSAQGRQGSVEGSLLDLVYARPDAFHDIGFVFVSEPNDQDVIDDINQQEQDEGAQAGSEWKSQSSFSNWSREEVASWPGIFFEFWLKDKTIVFAYQTIMTRLDEDTGHVLGEKHWLEITSRLKERGIRLPTRKTIAIADSKLARQLHDGKSQVFRNGFELIQALEAVGTNNP